MANRRLNNYFFLAVTICLLYRCTPNLQLIKVDPPASSSVPVAEKKSEAVDSSLAIADSVSVEKDTSSDTLDFSAILDSAETDSCIDSILLVDSSIYYAQYPTFGIKKRNVRIALERNISSSTFSYDKRLQIRSGSRIFEGCKGNITVRSNKNGHIQVSCLFRTRELHLPCTLLAMDSSSFIRFKNSNYRGTIVLVSEKKGLFSVINSVDVEEYLKGVVPLEIGKRPKSLIEALKAQAVAARTYTYKRMNERESALFDMTATIQDQVYGGANVEYAESDSAVSMTNDLILVYGQSIVNAYYHSTCGGKTANIEDVWDRSPCKYLKSIKDTDSSGVPYCSISPRFNWQEKWPSKFFFTQITEALKKQYPDKQFRWPVNTVIVKEIFPCGRVKRCEFSNGNTSVVAGGDKLRFIIKRDTPDRSILRSANFKLISATADEVLISGTGYGHGIGMCQMGAIGRAQKGQTFDIILKAYYTGVEIATVVDR